MSTHNAGAGSVQMPSQDRDLVRRCQRGDAAAYAELLYRHRKMVYRVACAITGSPDDAEDVVQDAFVRAYRAIHRYNPRYEFTTWVRRIAVNCAASKLAQHRRIARREQRHAAIGNPHPAPTPAEQAVANELNRQLRQAMDCLPLKQRVAITLFGLQDMDIAGTAQAMGCSAGTVKSHLHRARQKLAELMSDHMQEE